ncbi:transposase [Sphaerisporangium sp. NPDC088356]|uniref:transposase n=1 Tax=Sphaerisporangium sp. NPDC088356 TaxID=3154871 RepID=UPI003445AD35
MGHSVDPAGWRVILDEAVTRIADRFARAEPRATAGQFVAGLLSGVERKTCWSLAERAGHCDPQAMQRLLRTTVWDADAVRDGVFECGRSPGAMAYGRRGCFDFGVSHRSCADWSA